MRIKKVSQTTATQAQVVDGYSTSTIDSYSCNYINGLSKILWTNENPTSAISADTPVTLSSNDYDYLIWIYCYNNSSSNTNIQKSSICLKGNSVMMNIIGYSTGNKFKRRADYVSDTSYTLTTGMNDSNTADTSICIPLYVIGCKF